ncbi:coniferyl aldehyde dehydrogenase [mine drainage metagenome]|uniref:Coniferyl aldehyde dehydrogenase n=1 Tax=mine drainage metagenome TaxID=410659 RepID=A0A1J5Q661_9ZZZZ
MRQAVIPHLASSLNTLNGVAAQDSKTTKDPTMQLNFIANTPQPSASGQTLAVIDPSDGQAFDQIQRSNAADIDTAVAAARHCFDSTWRKISAAERGRLLMKLSNRVSAGVDELTALEQRDCGKPTKQARADAVALARYFEFYAGACDKLHGDTLPYLDGYSVLTWREPHGVTGHVIPWNYPMQIFGRSVGGALAAGNVCVVKPAEDACLSLIRVAQMAAEVGFPPGAINIVTGYGHEAGDALARHSGIDHISFTGSPSIGTLIQQVAAQRHCPVTLELGGKAPAIVCDDFPLRTAAERIMFVKLLNAGQICTTVDHAWLPAGKVDEFVALARGIVARRYAQLSSPDYTSIIDQRSFDRLLAALDEARSRGARVLSLMPGPAFDAASRKIAPHIVLDAHPDCALMQREIFGPILPLRSYSGLDEVIASINAGPRPLAVYPFSYDPVQVQKIIDHVMSGGVSVNDALFHVGQHDLPFGGVGDSGMGHYHGHEGFETFSKMRPVFYQARWSSLKFLMPPYGKLADRVLAFLIQ